MPQILIIDDDPHMLTSLSDVLQSSGYTVSYASSGSDALKAAETTPHPFDLVVADVRMEGMDGLECIQQLSGRFPKLKSVVITGFASEDVPARAMEAASCDYLKKPFSADDLLQSVSRALHAEKEGSSYEKLVKKARSFVQKMGAALTGMEGSRHQAFQHYYLGIRAGHLGASVARSIWEWLEATEWERLEAERKLDLLPQAAELKKGYERVIHYCKEPSILTRFEEGKTSQVEFQPFFKNIQQGTISCEQLKLAVFLRSLSPAELAAEPELQELRGKLWKNLTL